MAGDSGDGEGLWGGGNNLGMDWKNILGIGLQKLGGRQKKQKENLGGRVANKCLGSGNFLGVGWPNHIWELGGKMFLGWGGKIIWCSGKIILEVAGWIILHET